MIEALLIRNGSVLKLQAAEDDTTCIVDVFGVLLGYGFQAVQAKGEQAFNVRRLPAVRPDAVWEVSLNVDGELSINFGPGFKHEYVHESFAYGVGMVLAKSKRLKQQADADLLGDVATLLRRVCA